MGMMETAGAIAVWTPGAVQERLVEAFEFLDRHVPSGRYPFAGDGPWSLVVRDNRAAAQVDGEVADYVEPESDREVKRRVGLRSAEVDRMEATLAWGAYLDEARGDRRLVGMVCIAIANEGGQIDWQAVKRKLASPRSPNALRMRYNRAISTICRALTKARVPVSL
jgi:hypothetical protein